MEHTIDSKYQKGFNHGYLLSKHKPNLMKLIEKGLTEASEYTKGMLHGRAEYRKEKMRDRLKISPTKARSPQIKNRGRDR